MLDLNSALSKVSLYTMIRKAYECGMLLEE